MPTTPVVHEPRLPNQADMENVSELFGKANGELELLNFRLAAYRRPYFEGPGEPETARPTFEDIGRLTVLIEWLKIDRFALDEEIRKLEASAREIQTLGEGE